MVDTSNLGELNSIVREIKIYIIRVMRGNYYMITNTTRELINLALLNLESEKLIRSMINEAINYLNQAIIQIFELQKNTITQPLPYGADLKIPYIYREFYNHTFKTDYFFYLIIFFIYNN